LDGVSWSANVEAINSGKGWNFEKKRLSYQELLHNYYAKSTASLLILRNDPIQYTAIGFTEVIEALAMGRPVIMTKTGALPTQLDVEEEGCGLFVPPEDPTALANAMNLISGDRALAQRMADKARRLAERYYNIERYARDLHKFFESL
jgi:glycosyltransferase involved in cell wall biosynthesis